MNLSIKNTGRTRPWFNYEMENYKQKKKLQLPSDDNGYTAIHVATGNAVALP